MGKRKPDTTSKVSDTTSKRTRSGRIGPDRSPEGSIGSRGSKSARLEKSKKSLASRRDLVSVDGRSKADRSLESPEVAKLRIRRRRKRKQVWNNLLKVVQAADNAPRIVSQFETVDEIKRKEKQNPGLNKQVLGQNTDQLWDSNHINSAATFHHWLIKAKGALPSSKGKTPTQEVLSGKHYRQFKLAAELVYAKCVYTDDDADYPYDNEEHAKEATSPQHAWYRKNFDYYQHWQTIKAFPTTIKKKKKMLRYLKAEVEIFQDMKVKTRKRRFQIHIWWDRMVESISDFAELFKFWRNAIRLLHARFGVEVHYYFVWLRKLLVLEVVYLLFGIMIVVLPKFVTYGCTMDLIYPPCLVNTCEFRFWDILNGAGSFEDTCIYYHAYYVPGPNKDRSHHVAYKMIIFWLLMCVANTVIIFIRMASSRKFVKAATGKGLVYFNEVFCAWDFSMNSVELAKAKQEAISKELTYINSHVQTLKHRTQNEKEGRKLVTYLKKWFGKHGNKVYHWSVNIITLACAFLLACSFWFLLIFRYKYDWEQEKNNYFWAEGLYICGVGHIICPLIVYISDLQVWNNGRKSRNYWVVSRLTLIYACLYFVLFLFWYQPFEKCCGRMSPDANRSTSYVDAGVHTCRCFNCYETKMSEQVYCILVWEFIFSTAFLMVKEFSLHIILQKVNKKYTAPEPAMDYMIVKMIFIHSLLALVIQFSPLLSFFSILLYFCKFYVQKGILLIVYSHPRYQLHAGDYEFPYFTSYFVFFLLGTLCSLHIFATAAPSASCGPFQSISRNRESHNRFYKSVVEAEKNSTRSSKFLFVLWDGALNPGAGFALVILISGAVYIFSCWSQAHRERTILHQELLQLERQDRNFLLRAIYNFSTREKQRDELKQELVMDHNQIFRIKLRFIAALIVAGKRYVLSKQYVQTKEYREFLKREKKSIKEGETWGARRRRQTMIQDKLETGAAPTKETIEARRMSLITKFLYHTETIRLAHAASRRERQLLWAAEMERDAKAEPKAKKPKK